MKYILLVAFLLGAAFCAPVSNKIHFLKIKVAFHIQFQSKMLMARGSGFIFLSSSFICSWMCTKSLTSTTLLLRYCFVLWHIFFSRHCPFLLSLYHRCLHLKQLTLQLCFYSQRFTVDNMLHKSSQAARAIPAGVPAGSLEVVRTPCKVFFQHFTHVYNEVVTTKCGWLILAAPPY